VLVILSKAGKESSSGKDFGCGGRKSIPKKCFCLWITTKFHKVRVLVCYLLLLGQEGSLMPTRSFFRKEDDDALVVEEYPFQEFVVSQE
jgi:hypothetical protein